MRLIVTALAAALLSASVAAQTSPRVTSGSQPTTPGPSTATTGQVPGSIGITPVVFMLPAKTRVTVLTITNRTGHAVTVQIAAKKWSQAGGQDVLADTSDVLTVPAVAHIPNGGDQTVRIARMAPPPAQEDAYKIHIEQLPDAHDADMPTDTAAAEAGTHATSVVMRYAFTTTLLYQAPGAAPKLSASWQGTSVVLTNTGTATAKIYAITGPDGTVWRHAADYVLPGATMTFATKHPAPASIGLKLTAADAPVVLPVH